MNMTKETINGVCVVRLEGPVMLGDADALRATFRRWFEQASSPRVVVDMEKADQLDSAGLGALVYAAQLVRDRGGDLCFACLQKKARLVFEITRSYKVFDIYATVDEAVRAQPA
ncbi:MAG TPA: STAS domain-containing protein [Kiritimatiellia bacterium]|nr:STAS domain-containing protein [Kiritimatiellia bacterium]HMP34833.1 STAS domain-containing protein [Kiritimatiellia bacterium]